MATISEIQQNTEYKMKRTVETLEDHFKKLRTGRASTGLVENLTVDYYGSPTPLSQVGNLGVSDARTITIQPWDRKMIPVIEKAILKSDLGLNPATSGDTIRIPLPPLTEERRREITKVVRGDGEEAKVAIRNLRREANEAVKRLLKDKEVSEDEEKKSGLKETTLALDGIAIIVNPQNKVEDLDVETIGKIYTGEIKNWKEVGGDDAEIVLIGREAGSGTRDGFESITKTEDKCKYGQELTSTGDVITTVSQNPNAIGYASLAAVKDNVKALSVGKVKPTEETVKDGSYVVQRPFVLVTKEGKALSDTAQKFFDYVTSADASQIISDAGAVPVK